MQQKVSKNRGSSSMNNIKGGGKYAKIETYKGLKVVVKKQPKNAPERNGIYNPYLQEIIIYPHFYTNSIAKQEAILEHEFCHHCQFYRVPEKYISFWIRVHKYEKELVERVNTMSKKFHFDGKKFLNRHAQKHWREDMAEQVEYRILLQKGEADLLQEGTLKAKYHIANYIFDRFKDTEDEIRDVDIFIKKFG